MKYAVLFRPAGCDAWKIKHRRMSFKEIERCYADEREKLKAGTIVGRIKADCEGRHLASCESAMFHKEQRCP
jgi:hypothetical protein